MFLEAIPLVIAKERVVYFDLSRLCGSGGKEFRPWVESVLYTQDPTPKLDVDFAAVVEKAVEGSMQKRGTVADNLDFGNNDRNLIKMMNALWDGYDRIAFMFDRFQFYSRRHRQPDLTLGEIIERDDFNSGKGYRVKKFPEGQPKKRVR